MAFSSAMAKLSAAQALGGSKASTRHPKWIHNGADDITSDEDSNGERKTPKGSGNIGFGPALKTIQAGKIKDFVDGNGLCSPGRWAPDMRSSEPSGTARNIKQSLSKLLNSEIVAKEVFYKLATGKFLECPFPENIVRSGRALLLEVLGAMGANGDISKVEEGQPCMITALNESARLMNDLDWKILASGTHNFRDGVRNDFNSRLRQTPAVFPRKVRWKKHDDGELNTMMDNYKTASQHSHQLMENFKLEKIMGRVRSSTLEEAEIEYGKGNVRVAALLAKQKSNFEWRILHDGSHGVELNLAVKVRDQHEVPTTIMEKHTILDRCRSRGITRLGLKSDVSDAHRTFKIHRKDHASRACMLDGVLILNEVGTQGISSSAYWWARLFAVITRIILYIMDLGIDTCRRSRLSRLRAPSHRQHRIGTFHHGPLPSAD